jgi:hypothetical protein
LLRFTFRQGKSDGDTFNITTSCFYVALAPPLHCEDVFFENAAPGRTPDSPRMGKVEQQHRDPEKFKDRDSNKLIKNCSQLVNNFRAAAKKIKTLLPDLLE